MIRVAFDIRAPFVVASEELVCGARRFARGEAFPWRDLGVSEIDLLTLWTALKVDVSPALSPPAAPPSSVEQTSQAARAPSADALTEAELERLTAPSQAVERPQRRRRS